MTRTLTRRYEFTERDVREALVSYLKKLDLPAPAYVGNTDDCKWSEDDDKIIVEWTECDEFQ